MPFWISILIDLLLRFGLPWLLSKLPWLHPDVKAVLQELSDDLREHKLEKKALVGAAKDKIRNICNGVDCKVE